jgi:hypothetical protein
LTPSQGVGNIEDVIENTTKAHLPTKPMMDLDDAKQQILLEIGKMRYAFVDNILATEISPSEFQAV